MDVIEKTILYTSFCVHMDKYKYISDDHSHTSSRNKHVLLSVRTYYYLNRTNQFFVHTRKFKQNTGEGFAMCFGDAEKGGGSFARCFLYASI